MGVGDLSRANSVRILEVLAGQGATSRMDLGRALALAPATVNRLTGRLEDDGLVIDTGELARTGGRPSRLLDFNRRHRLILAVDVADHHTDIALVDLGMVVLEQWHFPTEGGSEERHRELLAQLTRILDTLEHRSTENVRDRVTCIGVSVPGPVDDDGRVLFAPALGWRDTPLRAELADVSALPVVVENDANLIALAEHTSGHWGDTASLVAIAVFDGIGSGIIEDGRIWRGSSGAAGQIGRMLMGRGSLSHEYEGFGDFESHIGAASLVRRARALGIPDEDGAPLDADGIMRRYAGGDITARRLVDEVLDEFALSLVNVCALLAPEVIVFAGLFERWGPVLLPPLRERLRGHVVRLPILAPGVRGEGAALIGAATLAFERMGAIAGLLAEE